MNGNRSCSRAQSNVVGVALLLGVTVISLGMLTASVGIIVNQHTASADVRHVATDLSEAIRPVQTTGVNRGTIAFTSGTLELIHRDVFVLNGSGHRWKINANALRFTTGNRGVTFLAGSILVHGNGWGRIRNQIPITVDPTVLIISVPVLRGNVSVTATGGGIYTIKTNVSHRMKRLGEGTYRIAVETRWPEAWKRQLAYPNATTYTRDFDEDGIASVVIEFESRPHVYLVIHTVEVSVS